MLLIQPMIIWIFFVREGFFILNGRKLIIKDKKFISEVCFLDERKFQIEIGKKCFHWKKIPQ